MKRSTSDRRRVFYIGFLGRLLFKLAATGGEEEVFFDSVILRCHWSMRLAPYGIHVQSKHYDYSALNEHIEKLAKCSFDSSSI